MTDGAMAEPAHGPPSFTVGSRPQPEPEPEPGKVAEFDLQVDVADCRSAGRGWRTGATRTPGHP